jgi:hypothetical protein
MMRVVAGTEITATPGGICPSPAVPVIPGERRDLADFESVRNL